MPARWPVLVSGLRRRRANLEAQAQYPSMSDVALGQRLWKIRTLTLHGSMLTAPLFLSLIENVNGFHIPGYCIFKIITGIDCPGCGMTNSAMELFRGNIQDSINLHPAGLIIISILAITTSYMVMSLAFQGNSISWQKEIKSPISLSDWQWWRLQLVGRQIS